jgi:Carboxypeptidase regulatory-like domain
MKYRNQVEKSSSTHLKIIMAPVSCVAVLLFSLLPILTSPQILVAQSGAGSIQGTVRDATGAVIQGAVVHVINQATGVATNSKSNSVGFYQVPDLFTGTYIITVSAPNMKTYKTSIDLLVAQNAVIDPVVTVGAMTQQVVVAGGVQLTTTDSGSITSTLENDRINQLPENQRELVTLAQMTTPGLEDTGQRVNGMLVEGLQYIADGVTTTTLANGGESNPQFQIQDPDSIQEVQMNTTDAGAQYATPATAIITTKSGTNGLHGTAFETALNNGIGVAKSRSDAFNYVTPPQERNEFGVSAGGPIILPHLYHGKDKSFWFFAYERYSDASRSSGSYKVPTMAMRQGNFNGVTNSAGIPQTIFDPSTTTNSPDCPFTGEPNAYCRTPFPGNRITTAESPTAKVFYDMLPQPTSAANPLVAANLTLTNPALHVLPQVTFRLDHNFNEDNRAYLRFSDLDNYVKNSCSLCSLAADGLPADVSGYSNNPGQSFITTAGYTHIFSPTFFAETIVGLQWFSVHSFAGPSSEADYETELGLPNNFGERGFPTVSGPIQGFASTQTSNWSSQMITNLAENSTKIVGRHQLHFGGRFQHGRVGVQVAGLADEVTFSTNPTGIYEASSAGDYDDTPNAGMADASMFLGSADAYTVQLEPPYYHFHTNETDAYVQDDYHVSRNLTLNLGLRYEAHPAVWTKYGLQSSFDLKNDAMVLTVPPSTLISEGYTTQAIITNDENIGVKFETPQEAGMPAGLYDNYYFNFLPRGGIDYQLSRKFGTVIRGGYGRYLFSQGSQNDYNHPIKNNPLAATYSMSYSLANQAIDDLPNELLRYNDPAVFGVMGVNTANVVNTATTNSILPGIDLWANSPDWAPVGVSAGNVTIEQPLSGNSALRVSWVWTHSTNLDIADDFNNAPSEYQWEMATGTVLPKGGASVIGTPEQNTYAATATGPYDQTTWGSGTSMHTENGWMTNNSLQANYQRLFHHGVAFQLYYAFSKTMRMGGDTYAGSATTTTFDPYANYPGAEGTVATMTSPYGTIGPSKVMPRPPANLPPWAMYRAGEKFEMYYYDDAVPYHHIQFNGIVDLPFGRGKRFFGNVNRFLNEVIGGFQIAGTGSVVSQAFAAPTGDYGPVSPLKVYKHKYPIEDCRSGVCYKAYMWYNGYLAPTVTQGVAGSVCTKNCVTGLPASYVPAVTPIDNTPGTTYYGENEVQITAPGLNGGKPESIAYDAGPEGASYYAHKFLNGPFNWEADASIFKVFPVTERVNLRIDMDAFNAFNVQGYNNPGSDGVEEVQPGVGQANSYNTPRTIQLTARLTF